MNEEEIRKIKKDHTKLYCELYWDSFEDAKAYDIPRAQLILTDIPYNVGDKAYGSNPNWYIGGDNKNGIDPRKAGKAFFSTDGAFNLENFFLFSQKLLKPEPKNAEEGKSPCMIVFCSYEQTFVLAELAKRFGFKNSMPLFFIKDYSAQVLKANMRPVGAVEFALMLYRDKLPKFNNDGQMVFNWFKFERDGKEIPKIHPTQKPVAVLKRLIEIFTDVGDVVIDPCAGSGTTLRASYELNRESYGFEVDKAFYEKAEKEMLSGMSVDLINGSRKSARQIQAERYSQGSLL